MPKLPVDFVKAPSFDNPLRATESKAALAGRSLMLHLDSVTWGALSAASEREGVTQEALVQRALERYLSAPNAGPSAPRSSEEPRPTLRGQIFEQLHAQFLRRSWVQAVLTLRAIVREGRA